MDAGWLCTRTNRSALQRDRKSTRLNSSHVSISYAVFCLKKKTEIDRHQPRVSLHLLEYVSRPLRRLHAPFRPSCLAPVGQFVPYLAHVDLAVPVSLVVSP